ncbi:transcriptional regulator GutM [Sebaldella sp. S0638]|uniref:transcriptional regulator GutM n=1 Tax=Sebaldella sp. S0638 TaxID=2957809 RepID=UPI0020A01B6B|nr:transcriptional regulator GutM [Sebaldella sp. S0638]MCP1226597.1 transcriptional regulator GutM [Sebaldella sp. S0638]
MNYVYIIVLVVIAMALQRYFIYLQSKNYTQILLDMKKRGNVGVGVAKGAFSGRVVILCSDLDEIVIEGKTLKGFSTFSRFKDMPEVSGVKLDDLYNKEYTDKKYRKSIKTAVEQIRNLKNKEESKEENEEEN